MKSQIITEKQKMKLSMKLKSCAILAIAIPLIGLTSCAVGSKPRTRTLNIYQPSSLRLKAGEAINTKDGVYTPQVDEVWHSDARYRKLEREIFN